GPLACPAQLVDVLAGEDHAAVDDSGRDRSDSASGDCDHGLVEQREPCTDVPVADENVALHVQRQREQVAVAVTLADLRRGSRGCGGASIVALGVAWEDARPQQVAPLDALALAFEKAVGAAKPAGRR